MADAQPVDVVEVTPVPGDLAVDLVFSDGAQRRVDLRPFLVGPLFEPLRDPRQFQQVAVDPETGTICWPNGADLDPLVLRYGLLPGAAGSAAG